MNQYIFTVVVEKEFVVIGLIRLDCDDNVQSEIAIE
jgi:hypothetical protein